MAIGDLLFFECLLIGEQRESDSGEFSGEDDFGSDFAESFVELLLIVIVEQVIATRRLSRAIQESPDFRFPVLGEFSFALELAGFAHADIQTDEGDIGTTAGEGAAMKDGGQSSDIDRPDAGDGQTAMIVGLPPQLAYQHLDMPMRNKEWFT